MHKRLGAERPLSPHLSIYKWQISSVLSIFHRATGVGLTFGLLFVSCWFSAAATSANSYDSVVAYVHSPLGLLVLFGLSFALYYHLLSGIRHLLWDIGKGYGLKEMAATGWMVVILSLGLTAITWYMACAK